MARIETWFDQDIKKPVKVRYIDGNLFSQDNQGNLLGVNVLDNGQEASISGTVSGAVIRADGETVAITGTLSGNKCSIVLPSAAYAVPGSAVITLKLTTSGVITTLLSVVTTIYRTSTDVTVDPGTIIPSIEDLIAEIEEVAATIPQDYSALSHSVETIVPADSENILLALSLTSKSSQSIDFDYVANGVYWVHGTSTANALCSIFSNSSAFPTGMQAGKYYFVLWPYSDMRFEITTYDSGGNTCTQLITSSRLVYIPANAVGVRIRINIVSGKTLDKYVYVNVKACEWVDRIIKAEDDIYPARIAFNGGYYIANNGSTADVSSLAANEGYFNAVLDCAENDFFTLNGKGGSTARLYAFIDASGNILEKAESAQEANNLVIIAPPGSAKVIINLGTANLTSGGCFVGIAANKAIEFQKRSLYFDEQEDITGEKHLSGAYWVRGYSDYETGIIAERFDYRITHANYLEFPVDVRLHINPNFTYNVFKSDHTLLTSSTRKDKVVPAGTKFRVNIRRYPEGSNTTPANVTEFANALTVFVDSADSIEKYAPTNLNTHSHTVAHRGVPNVAPGNTKPSYVLARQMGLIIAEGDVRFTSDDVAVLAHEATYTVDGVTHTIADETYEQFMQWDQGAGSEIYEGTYGLSLSAFLDLCNHLGLTPTIEFKVGTTAQIESCLAIIDAKRAKVFNYKASVANLKTIIDHDPYASVRLGADNYSDSLLSNIQEIVNYGEKKHTTHCIYSRYGSWTDEQINTCRNAGAIIGVSSINGNTVLKAMTQDVDIIFTESGFNAPMYYTINEME